MGISGLLPFLKKACRPCHVREFSHTSVAVDAYCLLHRGAFGCAERLAKNEDTDFYVVYVQKFVDLLLRHHIKPVLVFDGRNLPAKAGTERRRRENRRRQLALAKQYLVEGRSREARECFQRSVDVTPKMAADVIGVCHERNVDCVVAPYEADAQIAHLVHTKVVSWVITEDSDLVLFDCQTILFKMDAMGQGSLFQKERLPLCLGPRAIDFDFVKFRRMCITSGCDYLESLPGIGLGKSFKFWSRINNPDLRACLPKMPSHLLMPNLTVDQKYIESFIRAEKTFSKQVVFDVRTRRQVRLDQREDDGSDEDFSYAGELCNDRELALQLALGNICPNDVGKRLKTFDPDNSGKLMGVKTTKKITRYGSLSTFKSIWSADYDLSNFETVVDQKKEASTAFVIGNKENSSTKSTRKRKSDCSKVRQKSGTSVVVESDDEDDMLDLYGTATPSLSKKSKVETTKEDVTVVLESPPIKGRQVSVVSKYFFGKSKSDASKGPKARSSLFEALKERSTSTNIDTSNLKCIRRSLQ